MKTAKAKTIIFLTGAFVHSSCWDEWKILFKEHGYTCYSPAWPHKEASSETLRNRQPDENVAANSLNTLLAYYTDIINGLDEKPILIGHSIGGLVAQLLMQKELCSVAVAIHSVPPQGIFTFKFSFIKAGWRGRKIWKHFN